MRVAFAEVLIVCPGLDSHIVSAWWQEPLLSASTTLQAFAEELQKSLNAHQLDRQPIQYLFNSSGNTIRPTPLCYGDWLVSTSAPMVQPSILLRLTQSWPLQALQCNSAILAM